MRLFVYWFFGCLQISTGTISIPLDSFMYVVHFWASLFCISRIVFLSRHLPYYRKTRVLCLILAAFPLIYQFMMIKFLHSYFASCYSGTIQIVGIFPATTLLLQTCFQFAFIIKQFQLNYDHQTRESELRNAATYISQYNLFMLVHLACVEILSLNVDGWKTNILFLGVFELFTRIWGYYSFKNMSRSPLIIAEENLNRDELLLTHRKKMFFQWLRVVVDLIRNAIIVALVTRSEQQFGHSTSEDSVGYSGYSIDNTTHHKYKIKNI